MTLPRRLEATVALLAVVTALCCSCTATDEAGEVPAANESLGDVHPWLRDGRGVSEVDGMPSSYPYTITTGDGATVTYHQGPTPDGYPWAVVFQHADGGVEIHELDDAGDVRSRTYGSTQGR